MSRKKYILTAAAAAAVCVIGGVFAFWTQQILTHNEFQTAVYDTSISEEFESPDNWVPGQEVNKDAWVRNDSSIPVFVKVKIKQQWTRDGDRLPLSFGTDDGSVIYAADVNWGNDVTDISSITDISEARGRWLLCSRTPDENGEIEAFYIGSVAAGGKTPLLIDSVTMDPAVKAAIVRKDTRYNKETGQWETAETASGQPDYSSSHYTLTVSAETVQATSEAMREMFGTGYEDIYSELDRYAVSGREHKAKKLSFDSRDGRMQWSSKAESGENWFMSFRDMLPGQQFTDRLEISNRSSKTYDLYMQFIPKKQDKKLDELLEKISMKVIFRGKTIYEGTAAGKSYGSGDMRDVVKLCRLGHGDTADMKILLQLDPDTGIEYADLLTMIDCRFMVTEKKQPPVPIGPKTGDEMPVAVMIAILAASAAVITAVIIAVFRRKRNKQSFSEKS